MNRHPSTTPRMLIPEKIEMIVKNPFIRTLTCGLLALGACLLSACGSSRPRPTLNPAFLRPTATVTLTFTPVPATSTATLPPPTGTPTITLVPTPTLMVRDGLRPSPTPTPTEYLPKPAEPPMARLVGSIVIWHSWDESEVNALWTVISAFQGMFPNIGFDLLYVPPDELKQQYEVAVARGSGPSVLLAPAEWGPDYYEKELVVDFTPYVNPDFLATLNPAGLASGQYQGALISIPYALRGVVLYRNTAIIPQPAATFDELISLAQAATHDGAVGAVLERSLFYSAAHLNGLGGQMMDASGNPAFNNLLGLGWVGLLRSFEQAGVAVFNSNRDVQLFKQGKAGFIIDTSWNRGTLAAAIGAENLAIDPWPAFGNGHLSGFVQADSVFLNASLAGDDRTAALQFIGYLLAPEVQAVLAEVGHVPSGKTVSVRDPLVQQAMTALAGGTAYPLLPEADAYWVPLEAALLDIFERGVDPATALQQAYDAVNTRLAEIRAAQP